MVLHQNTLGPLGVKRALGRAYIGGRAVEGVAHLSPRWAKKSPKGHN
jgi:hypothetical protein